MNGERFGVTAHVHGVSAFCERPLWIAPHLLQVISTKKGQVGKKFKQDPSPYRKCPLLNARFKILRIPLLITKYYIITKYYKDNRI